MHTYTQHAPKRWVVVVAQLVCGLLMGVGTAYLGMQIGRTFFAGDPAGFGDIVASIAGIALGHPLGVTIGVSLAGWMLRRTQAWWAALLGSFGAGWGILALFQLLRINELVIGWGLFFVLAVIGATVADQVVTRRSAVIR